MFGLLISCLKKYRGGECVKTKRVGKGNAWMRSIINGEDNMVQIKILKWQ